MQTDRIQLRSPQWHDMQFIRWLWSDPETMKSVGGPIHLTDDQARRWFAEMIDPGSPTDCYRIIFNEENRPVGEISFHRLDSASMTAEFNIKIARTERSKGYAREAMLLFLDYFFNHFEGRVLIDNVALDNYAGQQALLRFGFAHDPTREEVFRLRMTREQYNDLYGLTRGRSRRGGRADTRPAAELHRYDASCAEIYDLFVRLPHDIPFFLDECQKTAGEVLELMAGTGRVSVPLLEAGVRLTCVDNSPEMVAVLRKKLQKQGLSARIYLTDVCRLSLPLRKQFDLILIALNSFSLLLSSAEQAHALSGIHDHLTDTGRFICILHNPTVRLQKNVDGNLHLLFEHPLKESEGRLFVWGLFNYDPSSKRIGGFEFIEIYDPTGVMISKRSLEIEYILHPQDEFEKMVQTCGFRIAAIYGDYDYSEFDPETSPTMIYVLEKINQKGFTEKTMVKMTEYIGQTVKVIIDRAKGSKHPKFGFEYPVNYGYVPGTIAGDGEELDAYVLGVEHPLEKFSGKCIAIIHRINDNEDKLIVVPDEMTLSDDEIRRLTEFQERFFETKIIRS